MHGRSQRLLDAILNKRFGSLLVTSYAGRNAHGIADPLPTRGVIGFLHPTMNGAHRAAYELFVGPIGEDLQIDHLCRNRRCVNPAHLEAVTQHENIIRGVRSRGREEAPRAELSLDNSVISLCESTFYGERYG